MPATARSLSPPTVGPPRLDHALRLVERLEAAAPGASWWRAGEAALFLCSTLCTEEHREQLLEDVKAATGPLAEPRLTQVVRALARAFRESEAAFERAQAVEAELVEVLLERAGQALPARERGSLLGRVEENRAEERVLRAELARLRRGRG